MVFFEHKDFSSLLQAWHCTILRGFSENSKSSKAIICEYMVYVR